VSDGKSLFGPRVEDARPGKPVVSEHVNPGPGSVSLLATSAKLTSPSVYHPVPELHQGMAVGRDGVIPEVSADDLFEPSPLLADRLVHLLTQFLLDLLELCPHAVAPSLPVNQEASTASFAANKGKAQEIEGLRLPEPAPLAVCCRMASELDQPGLLRVERQRELPHPFTQQVQEALGVGLVLETDDKIISVAHDDHVARCLAPSPALGIKVEDVEQVDIGKQRRNGSSNAKDNLRCLPVRRLCGRSRDHRHRLICLAKECSA